MIPPPAADAFARRRTCLMERFNGRIEDVLQSHRFDGGKDLEQTILRYVRLYNGQLPQSVLNGRTPIDASKDWQRQKPGLFRKRPYNHTGFDNYQQKSGIFVGGHDRGGAKSVGHAHAIADHRRHHADQDEHPHIAGRRPDPGAQQEHDRRVHRPFGNSSIARDEEKQQRHA